mmetsp:Transcript_11028/g.24277  ORF Transcript_11028/g.24277 Transcript_11028/m.24277 type:complete len:406 (+) Transcript_11028:98-1315(+)|eukprot:CAMPEP_0206475484 /NCGR_PEP_ID=MMETSP0324_2-20121206/34106_1 /ASSEMBLY_ACC=CAM_ASM_000836 /TAXON_ID=2866 /ORGANISM="Crypthecodinium cohnii, Strain Seligo" /LENGTH=405 /DNA_ID=CAMNT_0053950849 /DNA_START=49 /DNA_END=1266 /DNA_ORIENTATION=-
MSHRRAVYAARFLRPPGWTKRLLLREKPRELTGPYENPVRRWVRMREKASQFSELPPPRKVPIPKPVRNKSLEGVEGVPRISPKALENRLAFLLSDRAVEQQLAAPLRPGLHPYYVEYVAWERQMRELRRIYRAQYLQKLAEVTEIERANEAELRAAEMEERRQRKQAHLQRVGEEMKRRAILRDRQRVESKVNEALEMARRSKQKRRKLFWLRRTETLSKLVASSENLEDALKIMPPSLFETSTTSRTAPSSTGVLLSRNVSIPFLLRQLGGAKGFPQQKSRRIPQVDNIHREIMESSYGLMPEDEPRFETAPMRGPTDQERAMQLYGDSIYTDEQRTAMLESKLEQVERMITYEKNDDKKQVLQKLRDSLEAAKTADASTRTEAMGKGTARQQRGEDPSGLPA